MGGAFGHFWLAGWGTARSNAYDGAAFDSVAYETVAAASGSFNPKLSSHFLGFY